MPNREFVALLRKAADVYEIRKIEWKPRAYRKAARGIENLKKDIRDIYKDEGVKGLEGIPGVGRGIAEHIIEYLETGKVKKWEKLFRRIPRGATDLLKLQGLGPNKVKVLMEELGVEDINSLRKAIKARKIRELPGFGETVEKNLLKAIEMYTGGQERMLISTALPIAEELIEYIKENVKVQNIDYAGSLRRMKETIGDIDILVVSKRPVRVMDTFTSMPNVSRILAKGKTKSSVIIEKKVQVDLRVLPAKSYGAALQYFTGSKEHNVALRKIAIAKGYKLSEYGIFSKKSGKSISCPTERAIYQKLGLAYMPPEMREARGELKAAGKRLPKLVGLDDIRGDLHVHTKHSDGLESIEAMVKAAEKRGYEYIAITDHSPSERIANGLGPGRLKRQWKEIDRVAKKCKIKVLKGAEVDILPDGSLDYPDDILKKLHVTVCAVHSGFRMPKRKMTERIVEALENRYLDILGHPSGRLIGKREAYEVDYDSLFETAADKKRIMEINSQPQRLDLKDSHIIRAREYGLKFSIGTDAHSGEQLDYIRYGLGQARRGWLTRSDVVNTMLFSKLKRLLPRIPNDL